MLGHNFYHSHIRNYVAMFGRLFDDIYIQRDDKEMLKVPITYGPREKFLARATEDPLLNRPNAIYLPRMSFEMVGMSYDPARKLNKNNKLKRPFQNNNSTLVTSFQPVPYDINFELSVMTKSVEDAAKIVEQIFPFFTPDFTSTVQLNSELEVLYDIPLIMNGHSIEDTYEGDFETRRAVIHTLTFAMKAYFLGPVTQTNIIKFANTNIHTPEDMVNISDTPVIERVDTQPGLTANGQPTSNSSSTVPYTEINPNDDYGFVNTIVVTDIE